MKYAAWVLLMFPLIAIGNDSVFDWDFENQAPAFVYATGFAGQGHSDCAINIVNDSQVRTDSEVGVAHAAASLNVSHWDILPEACWTYAGWELGLGHDLRASGQQLTSDNLSDYQLSFDAWLKGTEPLPAIVEIHLQDDSQMDELGNPVTRVSLGNNRTEDDGDLNPITLTSSRQGYSMSLSQLGFLGSDAVDAQADLTKFLSSISSVNVEIEPQGVAGVLPGETTQRIGLDGGNVVFVDNVQLKAPLSAEEVVTQQVAPTSTQFIAWDFQGNEPDYTYLHAFAGQGSGDCLTNFDNTSQVSGVFSSSGDAATLDTSSWKVSPAACWTYAGLELGLGHQLDQRFASADLSEYTINFEAWVEGVDEMATVLQVHLQDNSAKDKAGNPVTRAVLGNNRTPDDGDLNELTLTNQPQSFSISLAALGFADLDNNGTDEFSQTDVDRYFPNITSLNIEIEAQSIVQGVGQDNDNVLRIGNLSFSGPTEAACVPGSIGDLDGDGIVSFPDFLRLSRNYGQQVTAHSQGDLDCDGTVAFPDFLVLSRNYGNPVAALVSAAVPEPSCFPLTALGTLTMLACRRNPRCR